MISKKIKGYPNYRITPEGYIKKENQWKWSRGSNVNGYLAITISNKFGFKRFLVHRLVALAYIPNPKDKPLVLHKNDIKSDNRVVNFKWGTYKENTADCINHGHFYKGEMVTRSKLTEKDIKTIRNLRYLWKQKTLAKKYGVSKGHIGVIQCGSRWKHVDISTRHRNPLRVRRRKRS